MTRIATHATGRSGTSGAAATGHRPREAAPAARHWWHEAIIVAVFYGLYSLVRDVNGGSDRRVALAHALDVVRVERDLGVFRERAFQQVFIHHHAVMRFWDGYYGTIHFVAVVCVLVYLYFRRPDHYRLWRNTLALLTALALAGFYFFPLLPPRLLPASYGFVDSLQTIGGFWDFKQGAISSVSNQYAAMPSLHTGWSLWCALALWGCVPARRWRPLLLVYPAATVTCIVVTANHFFADAAGGVVALVLGYVGARAVAVAGDRWRVRRAAEAALR